MGGKVKSAWIVIIVALAACSSLLPAGTTAPAAVPVATETPPAVTETPPEVTETPHPTIAPPPATETFIPESIEVPAQIQLQGFQFIDADRGWLVGVGGDSWVLAATQDAGLTWQALPEPGNWPDAIDEIGQIAAYVKLHFVDGRYGWARALPTNRLFETRDGGTTWEEVTFPWPVSDFAVSAGVAWALLRDPACERPADDTTAVPQCPHQLMSLTGPGEVWHASGLPVEISSGGLGAIDRQSVTILAGIDTEAWVRQYFTLTTRDGGATWYRAEVGQVEGYSRTTEWDIVDSSIQWLAFGNYGPIQGGVPMPVYLTTDGARSWQARNDGSLGLYGNVSYIGDLEATSAKDAWLSGADFPAYTRDGGKTWQFAEFAPGDGADVKVEFADRLHGWATWRGTLYRTVDGGVTWSEVQSADPMELGFGSLWSLDAQHAWGIVYLTDNQPAAIVSSDGGLTWRCTRFPTLEACDLPSLR